MISQNKRSKKALILALSIFLAAALLPVPPRAAATSASVSQKQTALQKAKANKAQAEKEMKTIANEKRDIANNKIRLQKEVALLEDEIDALSREIYENDMQIAEKEREIEEATIEAESYKERFMTRARVMYERGPSSYIEILLGATSFSDLISRVEMVRQVAEHDKEVLRKMANARQIIVNAKEEIENQREQKRLNLSLIEANRESLRAKLSSLSQLEIQLSKDENELKKVLQQAEKDEQRLQRELQSELSKQGGGPAPSSGQLQWPATGSITSPFGMRFHPIEKKNKLHTGIDIGAKNGSTVVAAEAGTVLRAGWNGGYGRYIVIDHGGGLSTLYAHNSKLVVEAGDKVTRGQKIAEVGSTGNSTGPHLHFEVLINGVQKDPMGYLK